MQPYDFLHAHHPNLASLIAMLIRAEKPGSKYTVHVAVAARAADAWLAFFLSVSLCLLEPSVQAFFFSFTKKPGEAGATKARRRLLKHDMAATLCRQPQDAGFTQK